jgi:hypothetical protein
MLSISGLSPANGEKNIPTVPIIELSIIDDGSIIDTNSLVILVDSERALESFNFLPGWDGIESSVSFVNSNLNIKIQPTFQFDKNKKIVVQVQVKNLEGKYLNYSYFFEIIKEEPILVLSSPQNKDVLKQPQFLYFDFEDVYDGVDVDSLNIKIFDTFYIQNGVIQTNVCGPQTEIIEKDNQLGIIVKIDPIEPLRDGDYKLVYNLADTNGAFLNGIILFSVKLPIVPLPPIFPQTGFIGFFQGIKRATNLGDGKSAELEWGDVAQRSYQSDAYVLIYQNKRRLDIFSDIPQYITKGSVKSGVINNLETGTTYSFAVRALEAFKNSITFNGMEVIDEENEIYKIPEKVEIAETVIPTANKIKVSSIQGYPVSGFLLINSEIIKYNGVLEDTNEFLITPNGRGVTNTVAAAHMVGDTVSLFLECKDENTVIIMSTILYHEDGYGFDRELNNVGLVVRDSGDVDNKFTDPFDFCGYRRHQPDLTLNGIDDCGSYLGGENNGFRGMNIFEKLVQREEILLDSTGEPVVLLKRIWSGQTCSCMTARRMHPRIKSGCSECYGTGYVGGYQQYVNNRRNDGLVLLSFSDTKEDLKLGAHESLKQEYEPQAWTLPSPYMRDRDLIVRFNFTGQREFVYEILDSNREKAIFRHFTRQRLSLKRMDKTDVVYSVPYILPNNIGTK